jgi:hypothetical protein
MTATPDILRADLRSVYMAAFENFAVNIGDVADLPNVGNYRYARELVGVLTTQGMLTEQDVNGDDTVYQTTPDTYDTIDTAEAERRIDEFLNRIIPASATTPKKKESKTMTASTTTAPAKTDFRKCGCGCEANVSGKSMYKPGHDARHAGQVARAAFALHADGNTDEAEATFATLPTDALQAKARGMVQGWIEKNNAKAARAAAKTAAKAASTPVEPEFVEGTVKKGRWEYPTRTYPGGVVEVNSKRDGSGEWVPQD